VSTDHDETGRLARIKRQWTGTNVFLRGWLFGMLAFVVLNVLPSLTSKTPIDHSYLGWRFLLWSALGIAAAAFDRWLLSRVLAARKSQEK